MDKLYYFQRLKKARETLAYGIKSVLLWEYCI